MKNLVAASALGSALVALVLPSIGGPMHYQVTKPFSLFGMTTLLPGGAAGGWAHSVALGNVPMDYVITDVVISAEVGLTAPGQWFVVANGARVACLQSENGLQQYLHLETGIPLPVGSAVSVTSADTSSSRPVAVTVCGYVQ